MEKECRACHVVKPLEQFYRNPQHADGYGSYCRDCHKAKINAHYAATKKQPKEPPPDGMKRCSRCREMKPIEQFNKNSRNRDGLGYYCRPCATDSTMAYHKRHPDKHREYNREWAARNKGSRADTALKSRLGLARGTYEQMLAAQDGKCAICGTTEPGPRIERFHVDHCATHGHIRGLLCSKCNQGIGLFDHDPIRIQAAISYLEKPVQGSAEG